MKKYRWIKKQSDNVCPHCGGKLIRASGCIECPSCGWSVCG